MSDATTTSGGPDDAASSGDAVEGKGRGAFLPPVVVGNSVPTHAFLYAGRAAFGSAHPGVRTDDMGKHDTDDTDDAEQRTLGAFDAKDDTDDTDDELREDIEQLRAEVNALRGVVESTVDTVEKAVQGDGGEDVRSTEAEPQRGYY